MWAKERYGEESAVPIVRALERTSEINKLTFDLAGISFRLFVWYPAFFRVKPGNPSTAGDSGATLTHTCKMLVSNTSGTKKAVH